MPSLSDIVGNAKNQVTSQVRGVKNQVTGGIQGAISNAKNNAENAVRGAASNVINTGLNGVVGAASQALTGNFSGAIGSLVSTPGNVADAFVSGLSGFSLTGAGNVQSRASSNGGVTPGDSLNGALIRPDPLMAYCWYAELPSIAPPVQQNAALSALGSSIGSSLGSSLGSVLGGPLGGLAGSAVGSSVGSSLGGSVMSGQQKAVELPWYYVEHAALTFRQFSTVEIFREGRDRKYPSRYSVDDLRLTLYLDSMNNTLNYLQAWNNAIMQPFASGDAVSKGGGMGRPANYKKTIRVYILSVTRAELCIIEYVEAFPTGFTGMDMTSGNGDRIAAEVTFSVGDVFVSVLPIDSTKINGLAPEFATLNNNVQYAVSGLVNQAINTATGAAQNLFSSVL